MSTLYLHIGPPKTGTTTIQNFLYDNQKVLNAHGICFPDLGYRYPSIDFHRNGHFLIRRKPSGEKKISDFEEGLLKILDLFRQYDSIILSDEGLWKDGMRVARFWNHLSRKLKEKQIDLRVIVYLRRQDLLVQSLWSQKIKVGKTSLCFSDYVDFLWESSYPMDYCAYMDTLSGLFGKENLIIRIMEKEQFQGAEHSLVSDFLDIFGLSLSDGFVDQQEMRNPKFIGPYVEIKRMLNTLPCFQDTRIHSFTSPILQVQDQNPFQYDMKKHSFFAPGEQKKFRDSFTESNCRLAREYLGREDGVLFLEEKDELPAAPTTDSELLHNTILIYGSILRDLKVQGAEQQKTIQTLRKDLNASSKKIKALSEKINTLSQEVTAVSGEAKRLAQENAKLKKSMEENSFGGTLRKIKKRLKSSSHSS